MASIFNTAFCFVSLCVFLFASSYPIDDYLIDAMREDVNCSSITFGAPENVKNECIIAALECVEKELLVASKECADPKGFIADSADFINYTLSHRPEQPKTNSTQCPCNKWPKTNFKDFLNKLESLIQQDNTANPSRR